MLVSCFKVFGLVSVCYEILQTLSSFVMLALQIVVLAKKQGSYTALFTEIVVYLLPTVLLIHFESSVVSFPD